MCDRILLVGHTGSHTPSLKDLSPILEGGCCFCFFYAGSLTWLVMVPRIAVHAAHNNTLMRPWWSRWCECVVAQPKQRCRHRNECLAPPYEGGKHSGIGFPFFCCRGVFNVRMFVAQRFDRVAHHIQSCVFVFWHAGAGIAALLLSLIHI